jgi:hypothetical protein
MDFPDLKSLAMATEVHHFREIREGETEDEYREALAAHVEPRDFIEAQEIRNGVGWDRWSEGQNRDMLRRKGVPL